MISYLPSFAYEISYHLAHAQSAGLAVMPCAVPIVVWKHGKNTEIAFSLWKLLH
jgi:hypothetical protein